MQDEKADSESNTNYNINNRQNKFITRIDK